MKTAFLCVVMRQGSQCQVVSQSEKFITKV